MKKFPENTRHDVDVILRDGSKAAHFAGSGNTTVPVTPDSIVLIHASPKTVLRYVRHGNDLMIYLDDGSVIECTDYFSSSENRLAFESAPSEFEQIQLAPSVQPMAGESVVISANVEPIATLAPLMESASTAFNPAWLWGGLGALAGGAVGAAVGGSSGGGGGGDGSHGNDNGGGSNGGGGNNGGGGDNGGGDNGGSGNNGGGGNSGDGSSHVIAITPFANNGLINAQAAEQALSVSGTSDFDAGTTVIVTVNGHDYSCVTAPDGAWCVTVPQQDIAALADAPYAVSVRACDVQSGNTLAQTATTFIIDTDLPVITFNPLGDNILNASELTQAQVLSGSVANAHPGDVVTLTVNGHTYQTTVNADMSWQVTLPAADLATLSNGTQPCSASVINYCGNGGQASGSFQVDTLAPSLAIHDFTTDNVINKAEHEQSQVITGTTTDAHEGDRITVFVGNKTWTTMVDANGHWQVGLSAEDMRALSEGSMTITAQVTDAAGNTRTAAHDFRVDITGPALTFDPVSTDDVINLIEKQQPLTITGTCEAGADAITVLIGGKTYDAVIDGSHWSVALTDAQVAALPVGELTVVVSASDSHGNSTTLSREIHVDSMDAPAISINAFTGDNILNATETGVSQVISGKVLNAAANDTVTVAFGGKTYTTTVNADLTWSLTVPAADLARLSEGAQTIYATIINGSNATAQTSRSILVDTVAPGIVINAVTDDDTINNVEHGVAQIISGRATGVDASAIVTVTLNGKTYTTTTDTGGNWSVGVPAADVMALNAGSTVVKAEVSDTAGNKGSATHNVIIDLTLPTIAINAVTADNILNGAEHDTAQTISGSTTGVSEGATVTVILNGKTYTGATDASGHWRISVAAQDIKALSDGTATITADVNNPSGNSATASHDFTVDTSAPAMTAGNVTADNIVNLAEKGGDIALSGTCAADTNTVTVSLNGHDYIATVSNGSWSVVIPQADAAALADGSQTLSVKATDNAGNSATATHGFIVDTQAPVVTINTVSADDVINRTEHSQAQIISGNATGVDAGTAVQVVLNDKTYTTYTDAGGNWYLAAPATDIAALTEGKTTISADVIDSAGNKGHVAHDVTIDLTNPTVTIGAISTDDVVNATEKDGALTLSGTCSADVSNVSVMLNGKEYNATATGGSWSIIVPQNAVATLPEGNIAVTATVTGSSGNTAASTHNFTVDTHLPVVSINTFCGDNIVNTTEIESNHVLSGKVTHASAGDIVTIQIGVNDYTATVGADLTWSVTVSSADLKALGNGLKDITAEVTNAHGNTGTGTREINIDAGLPGIYVNPITGDDVVNFIEYGSNVYVNGSCTGLEPGTIIKVEINGKTYDATVQAGYLWQVNVPVADVAQWADKETVLTTATSSEGQAISDKHDFVIDLSLPAIAINAITDDNVINANEKDQGFVITGSSIGIEEGQLVSVTFGGKHYTASVDADGNWSVNVQADDLSLMMDSLVNVQAQAHNLEGDAVYASKVTALVLDTPIVHITSMAGGDNIINSNERANDVVISGITSVSAGCNIVVQLNGVSYNTTANADGTWSVTVPKDAVELLSIGDYTVSVTATDRVGNTGTTSQTLSFDISAPTVAFDDPLIGDNVINSAEHNASQFISGTSDNAQAGDIVTLTLGGKTFTTGVDANGVWTFGIPASVITSLPEGDNTLVATITDKAGNSSSSSTVVKVITAPPTMTVDSVAIDDIVNVVESQHPLTISGTSNAADGSAVMVTLGAKTYLGTVTAGVWSVVVSAADVGQLANGDYTLTARVVDSYQNSNSATHDFAIDKQAPAIVFDRFATDNIVNSTEILSPQTLSGHVSNVKTGDTVTIHFGSKTYQATVKDDLSWSVNISAADVQSLGDGHATITAEVTTASGNHSEASTLILVDAGLPHLTIDKVSGDDVINVIEHDAPVIITGTCENVSAGAVVTVTVNGVNHNAIVQADGTWQVGFTSEEVKAWPAGEANVTASVNNSSGNSTVAVEPILVNLDGPAIGINTISNDNMVNALEMKSPLIVTGMTNGVEAGCNVLVKFGNRNYTAKVDADGNWSITLPGADLIALQDGLVTVNAAVQNKAGNRADSSLDVLIDSQPAVLMIDTIAGDNIINNVEHTAAVEIKGSSDAGEGRTVQVTLEGKTYNAVIDAAGKWSVKVPTADVALLTDGAQTVTARVADAAGNVTTKTAQINVDTHAPTLAFDNNLVGDDVINAAEHQQAQVITGTSSGLDDGAIITVKLLSASGVVKTFVTSVDENGDWSIGVSADVIKGLADGTYTFTADAKDTAGNAAAQAHHDVQVKTVLPEIAIVSTSAGSDDVLNKTEKQMTFVVNGTTNLPDDSVLTLSFNGKTYHPTVTGGAWSLIIPAADMASIGEGAHAIAVQAKDADGNTAMATHSITVDTIAPSVIINTIATDDIINAAESADGETIGGKVINGNAGDTVTIKFADKTYTATVQSDLTWSVNVSAADLGTIANGRYTLQVTATDVHGNTSDIYTHPVGVAIQTPEVTINRVAGDNVINKLEHEQPLILTGTASNLSPGDAITVTIGDGITSHTYKGSVQADGESWSVIVPQSDVAGWANGATLSFTATGADDWGNVSDPATATATVDLTQLSISLDLVAGDDIINAAEASNPAGLILTGSTFNAKDGDTVTVTFAGKSYTVYVNNPENDLSGSWSLTLPQGDLTGLTIGNANDITVKVTNSIGMAAEVERFIVYEPIAPVITIGVISGDNVLTLAEMAQPLEIKGTASLDAVGQTLTVTFNNKTYTTTVKPDGSWSVSVPAANLSSLSNGDYDVKAQVTDTAGNSGTALADPPLEVQVKIPSISINPVAQDNFINNDEHNSASNLIISGTTADAKEGMAVRVTFNDIDYTTTVKADGTWSIAVPAAVVKNLTDGTVDVNATIDDGHGNIAHAPQVNVIVDTVAPVIVIDNITSDNILNNDELANPNGQNITGTASVSEAGRTITVTLSGNDGVNQQYTAVIGADGKWSITVPPAGLAELNTGSYTINATVTDAAGNSGAAKPKQLTVDETNPVITLDDFTGDNWLNKAEQGLPQSISGTTTGVAAGKTVTIVLGDGSPLAKTYTATVGSDGQWHVTVSAADLALFTDGNYTITASVDSASGNHASASEAITVDTVAPTVAFDANVAGSDNIVNMGEQAAGIHVAGTTTADAGQSVTLTFNGGNSYTAIVGADGRWSIDLPGAEFTALADGDYTMTAVVTDSAGNRSAVAEKTVTVSDAKWTLTIDLFTGDRWLNAAEAAVAQTITGTTNSPDGQTVTITLNGKTYTAIAADGKWSCDVSVADLALLTEGTAYSIIASVTNPIGNTAQATQNFTVDLTAPNTVVAIISYTDDAGSTKGTFTTGSSDDKTPVINGTLSKAAAAGEQLAIMRNGVFVGYAVITGTAWSFADNLAGQGDGTYKYTAQYIDAAGNTGAIGPAFNFVLDTAVPTYAQMTSFTTTDTTPLLRGNFTGEFHEGDELTVAVHGKTYSSKTGAVVVDIPSQTWYLQIPDSDVLPVSGTAYTVNMTVISPGYTDPSASSVKIITEPVPTNPTTAGGLKFTEGMTGGGLTLNSKGEWEFAANGSVVNATNRTTWNSAALQYNGATKHNSSTFFDFDRDGDMDIISQSSDVANMYLFTNNGSESYQSSTIGTSSGTSKGSTIAIDINGDGFVDFMMGGSNNNVGDWYINKGNGSFEAHISKAGALTHIGEVTDVTFCPKLSAVDLNNDGKVDVAMQDGTSSGSLSKQYSSMLNNGDGTFNWLQTIPNIFNQVDINLSYISPMLWADFNNDGYMDLYTNGGYNLSEFININNGTGILNDRVAILPNNGLSGIHAALAIDWNHDGNMDIAEISSAKSGLSRIILNDGDASGTKFTKYVNVGVANAEQTTTALSLDYDWDGARDLLVNNYNGTSQLIHNDNKIAQGQSLHFKIVDKNGINCFFGNTVLLYDSKGNMVSAQILNPQSGIGANDSSALIDFYGLDPHETYRLELRYQENGVSKVISSGLSTIATTVNEGWGGIQAGDATDCYVLTVESDSASNNASATGTGYNDTLLASAGTDTYNGAGGWEYTSGTGVWSATGGMDIIDYKMSTVGVTIDLSKSGPQNTGYNLATLVNIEGFAGSNLADNITGSFLDNQIEGRGGNDIINIANGGHDTLLYKLITSASDDGGVGHDTVSGFNVAPWEGLANTGRVDIHDLLKNSGYSGTGSAHYINGVATLDTSAGNIEDYVKVVQNGDNVDIRIDRDGAGSAHNMDTIITLNNVHTDLATLLANHQLIVV